MAFLLDGVRTQVEHHDDKDEQDHDGTGIDNHLQCRNEGGSKREKDHRYGQQRHDEI